VRWCAIRECNISSLVNVNLINRATIKQEHARSITPTWFGPGVLLSNKHTHPFQEWFHLQYSLHFWSIWNALHNLLTTTRTRQEPLGEIPRLLQWIHVQQEYWTCYFFRCRPSFQCLINTSSSSLIIRLSSTLLLFIFYFLNDQVTRVHFFTFSQKFFNTPDWFEWYSNTW